MWLESGNNETDNTEKCAAKYRQQHTEGYTIQV